LARRHLLEDRTFASPFISLTQNPKRALRLILDSDEPLHLAIVDYNVLEEDLSERYRAGPWLVPQICDDHDLGDLRKPHDRRRRDNTKPYTGTGEVCLATPD
jgi:hypothetical protein